MAYVEVDKNDIVGNERVYTNVVKQIQKSLENEISYKDFYDYFGGIDLVESNILYCTVKDKHYTFYITNDYELERNFN